MRTAAYPVSDSLPLLQWMRVRNHMQLFLFCLVAVGDELTFADAARDRRRKHWQYIMQQSLMLLSQNSTKHCITTRRIQPNSGEKLWKQHQHKKVNIQRKINRRRKWTHMYTPREKSTKMICPRRRKLQIFKIHVYKTSATVDAVTVRVCRQDRKNLVTTLSFYIFLHFKKKVDDHSITYRCA